jgi:hypothetical protein
MFKARKQTHGKLCNCLRSAGNGRKGNGCGSYKIHVPNLEDINEQTQSLHHAQVARVR